MPGTRVLALVEDDASVRMATRSLIRSMGFEVDVFASAEEFLRFGSPQETSCLVLDVHMPGMSGLQLQDHLAAAGYSIPVIFITGYADEKARIRALQAGALDFLVKPFCDEALLNGIRSALAFGEVDGESR